MALRRPLDAVAALGALAWPVGFFAFGGFEDDSGAAIIAAGSLLALSAIVAELSLRLRDKRPA